MISEDIDYKSLPIAEQVTFLEEKVKALQNEVCQLKMEKNEVVQTYEREEEFMMNKLMKQCEQVKMERDQIVCAIEQEEEYLTNALQKRLNRVEREKIELENSLEQEEEMIVNKLQKRLEEKRSRLHDEKLKNRELADLRSKLEESQKDSLKYKKTISELRRQLDSLENQQFLVKQKMGQFEEITEKMAAEKTELEMFLEIDDERLFNLERRNTEVLSPIPAPKCDSPILSQSGGVFPISPQAPPPDKHLRNHTSSLSSLTMRPDVLQKMEEILLQYNILFEGWISTKLISENSTLWEDRYIALYDNGLLYSWENEIRQNCFEEIDLDNVASLTTFADQSKNCVMEIQFKREGCESRLFSFEDEEIFKNAMALFNEFVIQ